MASDAPAGEILELFRGDRRVARSKVTDAADPTREVDVSTVFLVMNHQYGDGPPLLFETMTFEGDWLETDCERYATEIEAEIGHRVMVEKVAGLMADPVVLDL